MTRKKQEKHLSKGKDDIAIIGMACVFPKAPDLKTYWRNIVHKVDAIGDPPEDRRIEEFYDPDPKESYKTYCSRGGYLEAIPPFRPFDFGIMPVSIDGAEPEHFLALQVAHDALLDAGFPEKPFNRERVEVILGRGTYVSRGLVTVLHHGFSIHQTLHILEELHPEYSREQLEAIRDKLRESIPPFNPETAPGLVPSVMAGLIANRLDLRGANYVVDAACASALIAAENGMQDLLSGRCDVVLTGAVQTSAAALMNILFTQFGALSRKSELHPFSSDADGTMIGEGVGMMVLKRYSDAVRDGHRIYSVIKGVGSSSDGRAKGILAPRLEGELLALQRAYMHAGVDPRTVGLIEAHGTAIPLGDETEVQALLKFFGSESRGRIEHAVGTVKSMIGHLLPAAGIAGIIKTALALHHKILPATLHCEDPRPELNESNGPFYVNAETRPWIHGAPDGVPRRAGVNAFGFGGINAHMVLEEAPLEEGPRGQGQRVLLDEWDTELCLVQAPSRETLLEKIQALLTYLSEVPDTDLADLAYTLSSEAMDQPCRLAVVAASVEELVRKLEHVLVLLKDPKRLRIKDKSGIYFFEKPLAKEGRMVFLFPGEGSQYAGMLEDLCLHFPGIRACFDELDRAFAGDPEKIPPSRRIFPKDNSLKRLPSKREGLWEMEYAVDAVLTADKALFEFLGRLGIRPDVIVGHSSGEIMALEAAGAIKLSGGEEERRRYTLEGNKMIRGFFTEKEIPEAHLIAAGGVDRNTAAAVAEAFRGEVFVAMENCPHQIVLCAGSKNLEAVMDKLKEAGALCQVLPFSRPYHTPLFEPGRQSLEEFFRSVELVPPDIEMYSCMTAQPMPPDPSEIRRLAAEQWARPVRFQDTVEAVYEAGARVFVEIGPRSNLTSFVQDTLRKRPHLAVALNVHHRPGLTQLHHALGLLAAHGVSMNPVHLFDHRMVQRLDLEDASANNPRKGGEKGSVELSIGLPLINLDRDDSFVNELRRQAEESNAGGAPRARAGSHALSNGHEHPEHAVHENGGTAVLPARSRIQPSGDKYPQKASAVMEEHFKTMERFLETQEQVMNAYLSASPGRATTSSSHKAPHGFEKGTLKESRQTEGIIGDPQMAISKEASVESVGSPAAGTKEKEASHGGDGVPHDSEKSIEKMLFELVSERTGYPVDILSPDQSLEADLGIDSIKRVEILGALARRLELGDGLSLEPLSKLKTLGEIILNLKGDRKDDTAPMDRPAFERAPSERSPLRSAPAPAAVRISAMPFQGKIMDLVPGKEIRVLRELDLQKDRFLKDHTLGGHVSRQDRELFALPVLPFAMSLEMMAENASRIFPHGHSLIAARGLKTHSWIALERDRLPCEIHAQLGADPSEARVELSIPDSEGNYRIAVEGVFVFGHGCPEKPPDEPFLLREEAPCSIPPEEYYPSALYHGPSLRCVLSMERVGKKGSEALLRPPSLEMLFRDIKRPLLVSDPVLLDGAGQAIGIWAAATLHTGKVVFPVAIDEVSFYDGPGKGEPTTCRAHSALVGETGIRSDVRILRSDGSLRMKIKGLTHKRLGMPEKFHRFRGSRAHFLGVSWDRISELGEGFRDMVCCQFDATGMDFESTDGALMRTVLAYIVLSRGERLEWFRQKKTGKRGTEWLLGRVAAKEAVRMLLKRDQGIDLWPADIEIFSNDQGQPVVRERGGTVRHEIPFISISHSKGSAVALASAKPEHAGIGVDMEHFNPERRDFEKLAFTEEERALMASSNGTDRMELNFRAWCAKEAVGKSLGRGILNGIRDLSLKRLDMKTGAMEFEVNGTLVEAFPDLKGKSLTAFTLREDDFVYAVSARER